MIETNPAEWCRCEACQDLREECGRDAVNSVVGSHYGWLSRKLLVKGWAGQTSPAERAYQKAHATWAHSGPPSERQLEVRARFKATYVKTAKDD